jgi:hypothetical protein
MVFRRQLPKGLFPEKTSSPVGGRLPFPNPNELYRSQPGAQVNEEIFSPSERGPCKNRLPTGSLGPAYHRQSAAKDFAFPGC